MDVQTASEVIPGALGAVAGGGGVAWLTRVLLQRLIGQYDKILAGQSKKLEYLNEKFAAAQTEIAVLKSHLEDARRLRIDLEQRFASLKGEHDAKVESIRDEINELRRDIFIAHERIRAVANGDQEISKIQAPPIVRRR